MIATRDEVYVALDSERDYQEFTWDGNPLTIGEFLTLMDVYLTQAKAQFAKEPKPELQALDTIRKIGGIAVNCMEQHGAPCRK